MPVLRALLVLLAGLAPTLPTRAADDAAAALAVIVPLHSGPEKIDLDTLALIYKRRKTLWDGGGRIEPVNLPLDHPQRRLFSRSVLHASPESLEDYWNQRYFQGVLPPHVLESSQAVLRFVAATDHAIGYLPYCEAGGDAGVRVLLVIGADGRRRGADELPSCP